MLRRQLLRSTFLFYLPPEDGRLIHFLSVSGQAESRFAELVVEIRDFLRLKQAARRCSSASQASECASGEVDVRQGRLTWLLSD